MKFKYCTSYYASQDRLKKDSDKKSDSRKKKKSEKKDKKQKKKDKKETGKRKTKVEKKRRREERDQDADEDEDEHEDTDDDKGSDDQGGDDKGGDDKGGETPSSTETIFGDKGDDKGGHDKGDVDYEVGYDEEMRLAWRIPVRGPLSRRCATRDYASSIFAKEGAGAFAPCTAEWTDGMLSDIPQLTVQELQLQATAKGKARARQGQLSRIVGKDLAGRDVCIRSRLNKTTRLVCIMCDKMQLIQIDASHFSDEAAAIAWMTDQATLFANGRHTREQIEANKKAKIKSSGKDKTNINVNNMRCSGLRAARCCLYCTLV